MDRNSKNKNQYKTHCNRSPNTPALDQNKWHIGIYGVRSEERGDACRLVSLITWLPFNCAILKYNSGQYLLEAHVYSSCSTMAGRAITHWILACQDCKTLGFHMLKSPWSGWSRDHWYISHEIFLPFPKFSLAGEQGCFHRTYMGSVS